MVAAPALVLSCEHGGREIPRRWRPLFDGAEDVLAGHEGWDPGALGLARTLSRRLGAPLVATTTTRLLVEPNRSPGHPRLFSRFTRQLPRREKEALMEGHWRPHRQRVEAAVRQAAGEGGPAPHPGVHTFTPVLHLGVHTFTPVLAGRARAVDVGILYDPGRPAERALCGAWARALREALPDLRIRRNAPYRGASDGLTTALRRRLPPGRYLGVELEVGQGLLDGRGRFPRRVADALVGTLSPLIRAAPSPGSAGPPPPGPVPGPWRHTGRCPPRGEGPPP